MDQKAINYSDEPLLLL